MSTMVYKVFLQTDFLEDQICTFDIIFWKFKTSYVRNDQHYRTCSFAHCLPNCARIPPKRDTREHRLIYKYNSVIQMLWDLLSKHPNFQAYWSNSSFLHGRSCITISQISCDFRSFRYSRIENKRRAFSLRWWENFWYK